MKVLLLSLLLAVAPLSARACELALVIALDVSRSVDKYEYALMRNGVGQAFMDNDVIDLIEWMPGGMKVTVTQWGGVGQQRQPIFWRHLSDRQSVARFVAELVDIDRGFWMADTNVSEALLHADQMFRQVGAACRRQVIDVSGDGVANAGPKVLPIAAAVGSKGVTINGLVVSGARPDPVAYYVAEVIHGPMAFVEVTHSYQDYARAMKRKLLRELAPNLVQLDLEIGDRGTISRKDRFDE